MTATVPTLSREQIERWRNDPGQYDCREWMTRAQWNALCDMALASRSGGVVSIKMLVNMLEASAANTDTDWRWQTATALRQHPHWETATIPLAASGGKGEG